MTIWSLTENPKIFWHFHGLSSCQCENSGWYFPLEAKFDFKSSDFALNSKLVTYLQWETALFKINIIWSPLIRRSTSALSTTRVGYCQILQKYQILVGGVMQIKNGWVGYLLPKSEKGNLVQTAFEGFCKNIFGWKRTKTKCNAVLARRVFANSLSASNQIRTLGNTQACCQIWCIPLASNNRAADLGKFSSDCKKREKDELWRLSTSWKGLFLLCTRVEGRFVAVQLIWTEACVQKHGFDVNFEKQIIKNIKMKSIL